MIKLEKVDKYLPSYLSGEARRKLFFELSQFPDNIDSRLYTGYLKGQPTIYQGDGIRNVLFVDLPKMRAKEVNAMILSNTCDIYPENRRYIPVNVIYAPIVELNKYEKFLIQTVGDSKTKQHINSIRRQEISHIFYLPEGTELNESIVFFDRINSCEPDYFTKKDLNVCRIFTLSDYGFYLFIYKIAVHFTRIREEVERKDVPNET